MYATENISTKKEKMTNIKKFFFRAIRGRTLSITLNFSLLHLLFPFYSSCFPLFLNLITVYLSLELENYERIEDEEEEEGRRRKRGGGV